MATDWKEGEGRLFDKEVTTLGVSDKEKRGTGLVKKKLFNNKKSTNFYYSSFNIFG